MMGLCIGAAYQGRKPVAYSITPFLIYRPFELIRNYVNKEGLNIKLIGSGRDKDYSHDGFSHWSEDDRKIMENFENIKSYWPEMESIESVLGECFNSEEPYYINLKR
jgi:transketolase